MWTTGMHVANYIMTLRKELLALSRACGVDHPSLVTPHQVEILDGRFGARTVADLLGGRGRGVGFDEDPATPAQPMAFVTVRRG